MIQFVNSYILKFSPSLYLFIFFLAYASLPKRRVFWLREGISLVCFYVVTVIFPGENRWLRWTIIPGIDITAGFIVLFLFALVSIPICFQCSWQSTCFVSIIAWMLQHSFDYTMRVFRLATQLKSNNIWSLLFSLATIGGIICLEFFFLKRKLRRGDMEISNYVFILMGVFSIVAVDISGQVWSRLFALNTLQAKYAFYIITLITCMMLITFHFGMLQESNKAKEYREMKDILSRQNSAQRSAKANYEAVQIKIHDLKAQVNALRLSKDLITDEKLNELDRSLNSVGSVGQTGNHMLDVLLSEKSALFSKHKIQFTIMADGGLLTNILPEDIYALFGNALDNVFEAELKEEKTRRSCTFQITKKGDFAFCTILNSVANPPKLKSNELPVSSKKTGAHGYGLLSMKTTAEKYGGTMVLQSTGNSFSVRILLPISGKKEVHS